MLFNSLEFLLIFFPLSLGVYFLLNHYHLSVAAKCWLVLCSLFFYAYWNPVYLPLILVSIAFNFSIGESLAVNGQNSAFRKAILYAGVAANLTLLAYYKYAAFFADNLNQAFGFQLPVVNHALPLGISFFTFTQIAYLVDRYRSQAEEKDFMNYLLFVTFYPHLIAGPIVHHRDLMGQFDKARGKFLNSKNMAMGLSLFFMGLFKKTVLADSLAGWVQWGFDKSVRLDFFQAWAAALSYSFQLYFDFSGYIDMALGSALCFNILLPINFNSPYRASNVQDFWRRWNMTLTQFLRDYLYFPLGGNRVGEWRSYRNVMIVFLLGGLWHGASWTFVAWGFLHGLAMVVYRLWQKTSLRLGGGISWALTFIFVTVTWVLFRAKDWTSALKVLKGMVAVDTIVWTPWPELQRGQWVGMSLILFSWILCLNPINSNERVRTLRPTWANAALVFLLGASGMLGITKVSEFLYFNF